LVRIVYVLENRESRVFRVFSVSETLEAILIWPYNPQIDGDRHDVDKNANNHCPLTHDLRSCIVYYYHDKAEKETDSQSNEETLMP